MPSIFALLSTSSAVPAAVRFNDPALNPASVPAWTSPVFVESAKKTYCEEDLSYPKNPILAEPS